MNDATGPSRIPEIRVPGWLTLGGLIAGLTLGLLTGDGRAMAPLLEIAGTVGTLWLQALKMTILPLVCGLLFTGIADTAMAARAGALARRTLGAIVGLLALSTLAGALLMPLWLRLSPVPAGIAIEGSATPESAVPTLGDFFLSLIPSNVMTAAAEDSLLPVIIFIALFAAATTRLSDRHRIALTTLFEALMAAMLVLVGWVLKLAPIGVFALGLTLAASSGASALGALAHYIALVSSVGLVMLVLAYPLALFVGRRSLGAFARAVFPAQVFALSTQSSLASLPTMLSSCSALRVTAATAEFVLPLAVTLFRATSPGMNVAVCIYAAHLAGVELTPAAIAAGALVAFITTFGTVSLPGTLSFIASTAPIAAAMGAPLWPLGVLVAVEMLPDMMRTVANVTMDVALATSVDAQDVASDGEGMAPE
ncbi:dicarboxylate/amino acid:cation symporter [Novosphingobium aquimarinum]|uniref:dicarboxylate/amino acid:cation symporter n=1 Tax=Novosphingobium aquimarinum TaxID=2682494 RepID=UPI0012EBB208|nr:cation:dicarboxylase symporter family transporter [Novosphingobium aquimarinum]